MPHTTNITIVPHKSTQKLSTPLFKPLPKKYNLVHLTLTQVLLKEGAGNCCQKSRDLGDLSLNLKK